MYIVDEVLHFPDAENADSYGLLAIGGDLSTQRLQLAYTNGIFPWFEDGQPILWYSPNPRMVLFFDKLRISKSMKQLLKKRSFVVTINTCFDQVITNCALAKRKDQESTWITNDMIHAYNKMHEQGKAVSVEVWQDQKLVGGLYGIDLKKEKVFCGESMFSNVSNASKVAFIYLCKHYAKKSYKLIDCQMHTDHLASLGAEEIPRNEFISILKA